MKYFRIIISLFLTLSFLASCSMEKRVYMRGYHVDRNQKRNAVSVRPENEVKDTKDREKKTPISPEKKNTINSAFQQKIKSSFQKSRKKYATVFPVKKKNSYSLNKNTQHQKQNSDGDDKRIVNPSSIFSFANTILASAVFIFALLSGSLTYVYLGILVAIILEIIALVSGITALSEIKANPEKYRVKWLAFAGIGIPIVVLIVALISAIAGFN